MNRTREVQSSDIKAKPNNGILMTCCSIFSPNISFSGVISDLSSSMHDISLSVGDSFEFDGVSSVDKDKTDCALKLLSREVV